LKAKSGWSGYCGYDNDEPCENGNGSDKYGFEALSGGDRTHGYNYGKFGAIGEGGYWWTATESNKYDAHVLCMYHGDADLSEFTHSKINGYSVRCIKEDAASPPINTAAQSSP